MSKRAAAVFATYAHLTGTALPEAQTAALQVRIARIYTSDPKTVLDLQHLALQASIGVGRVQSQCLPGNEDSQWYAQLLAARELALAFFPLFQIATTLRLDVHTVIEEALDLFNAPVAP